VAQPGAGIRFAIILAVVLYGAFGALDQSIDPQVAGSIWVIRYAIVCPVALAVLMLTFTRRHRLRSRVRRRYRPAQVRLRPVGDTVNLASRLQSHSQPGRILVSERVVARLQARYAFGPRLTMALKGKGPTPARFLLLALIPSEATAFTEDLLRQRGR
jgi:hypothetical protein